MTKDELAAEMGILANKGLELVKEQEAIDVQLFDLTVKSAALVTEMHAIRDILVKLKAQYDVV